MGVAPGSVAIDGAVLRGGGYCSGPGGRWEIKVYSDNMGAGGVGICVPQGCIGAASIASIKTFFALLLPVVTVQQSGTVPTDLWRFLCYVAQAMTSLLTIFRRVTLPACVVLSACGGGGGGSSGVNTANGVETGSVSELPAVSWYSTAKPLIDRYCVACHTDGGLAPFPLETHGEVVAKRSAMIYVLESGSMPPLGYAGLRPGETSALLAWLNSGAPLGDPSQAPQRQLAGGFSYHGDARAIIEEKCVNCHEEGGIAPFPLDSYEKVKAVKAAAAFAIENGSMPPWHPTDGYTSFASSRALTPEQEYVLLNWLQGDMPEGDPANYEAPPGKTDKGAGDYNLRLALPQA